MSAFISVEGKASLAMVTDGASYTRDGVVTHIGHKVDVGKKAPVAMTTRGRHVVGQAHQRRFCDSADKYGVDFAIEAFGNALPEMQADPIHKGMDWMQWHILAFSESRGLIRLAASNIPEASYEAEGLHKLVEVPASRIYAVGAKPDLNGLASSGVGGRLLGEDHAEYLIREGANIMEAMRKRIADPLHAFDVPGYFIGGLCDLTIVTEHGATVQTVRTWPDRVGSVIDPFASNPTLNRQQRRVLERQARKQRI